jgi:hypothetical protein
MIVLTLALLLLNACVTSTIKTVDLSTTLLIPEVHQKIPISVGLYYTPEFANYGRQRQRMGSDVMQLKMDPLEAMRLLLEVWDVPLGGVSVQLLDQASRVLFAKVVLVSERAPGKNLSLDCVIEPSIEAFQIEDSAAIGGGKVRMGEWSNEWATTWAARIRYRFDIYDGSGSLITSWIVIGDAAMLMLPAFESDSIAVLIGVALQDAMRQFAQDFGRNPEVVRWLGRKKPQ